MKEKTKIIISFKSKNQVPLLMIIKLYYRSLEDKSNDNEYYGDVLFDSDNIKIYILSLFKKIQNTLKLIKKR